MIDRVNDEIDLRGLGQTLWRRRAIVAVPVALGLVIGLVLGFAVWQPSVQEAHALVQSAKGTGDLYSSGTGIAILLQDYSFRRQALQGAQLGDAFTAGSWSVTAIPQPGQDDLVALTVQHQGPPGPDARRYAQALTDELSREADKIVSQRRQATLDNLTNMSATAEKFMAANGRSLARAFSGSARAESDVDRFLRLSVYNSTTQGLITVLFQTQRDLTLQLNNFRPASVIGDIWMTQTPPRQRGARAAVAGTLLGAVIGVWLALLTEAMRPARRFGSEETAAGRTSNRVRGIAG